MKIKKYSEAFLKKWKQILMKGRERKVNFYFNV